MDIGKILRKIGFIEGITAELEDWKTVAIYEALEEIESEVINDGKTLGE